MEAAATAFARAAQQAARWSSEAVPRYFKHMFGQNAATVVVDDPDQLPPSRCRLNKLTRRVKDIMLDNGVKHEVHEVQQHELAAAKAAEEHATVEAAAAAAEPSAARRWLLF